ncbi:hypothetical protein ACE1TI_13965 [Alteribacillus sp. JSM 102045]|uniref:hypothetical protein n=1 Tax=Alteribacillus sp. JSM 102045 TaxID=1562101 RepID=UPI0035C26232
MTKERKDIIIKEIKYWKTNNLLPPEYCNFLLMLYSEGEELEEEPAGQSYKQNFLLLVILLLGLGALGLTFIVIYFTSFSLQVQTLTNLFFAFNGVFFSELHKK